MRNQLSKLEWIRIPNPEPQQSQFGIHFIELNSEKCPRDLFVFVCCYHWHLFVCLFVCQPASFVPRKVSQLFHEESADVV